MESIRKSIIRESFKHSRSLQIAAVQSTAKSQIYSPSLGPARAQEAALTVHKSKRGNPVDYRRTYWYQTYAAVLQQSKFIFILQNNNLPAQKYKTLKNELKSKDLECLAIRNTVFSAAARNLGHGGLKNLFQGPTMIWFSAKSENDAPDMVKDIAKLADRYKQHLLLVGASLDGFVLSADTFASVKQLPPKTVLYGELLGLLSYPGSNITRVLSQTPSLLASSLEQHLKDQEKE